MGALLSSFTEGLMSEEAAKLVGIAAFALLVFSLLKLSLIHIFQAVSPGHGHPLSAGLL